MRKDIAFPAYNRNANSDDLIWSIYEGHWTGFKSGGSTSRSFQTSVPTAVDAHTVKIEFEQATFGVAYDGFTVREETTHLTPAKELLAMGNGDSTAGWAAFMALEPGPISSGAYQYVRQVPQEFNEYKVNTKWFGPAPDFEKFIFQEVKEPGTRLALLATEKADLINLSAPTLVQANAIDHAKVIANPSSVFVQFFFLNLWEEGHPAYDTDVIFLNKDVRTAFNTSVNRAEINEVIYGGASVHQDAPILNPVKFAWDHPIVKEMRDNPIPYDVAGAKALLAGAGLDLSKEIPAAQRGASSAVPEWPELNEAVVNGWIKDLGANVVLEQTKENVYSQLHNGQGVKWWLWGGERIGGAGRHSLGPARYFGPGSVNFAASHWDQISDMREMALGANDMETYKEWNAKISKLQRDEALMIPLMVNPIYYGANKDRVESWPMTPGITREHYMEHIRATDALRASK
jgi:ABC-type transport system substrate-binding protein